MGNDRSPETQRNSKVKSAMWPNFQFVEYFLPILFICKFHKDWIKITWVMLRTKSNVDFFWHSRASNSKVNTQILPEFELDRDFMHVQVICNFHKDQIKTKQAMFRTNMGPERVGQVTPKWIVRSVPQSNSSKILWVSLLPAVPVTCKFEDDLIKNEGAIFWTTFSPL